jgi:two-component system, NtrC family, response regulator HydG
VPPTLKALVVDDDAGVRALVRGLLARVGLESAEAEDGIEALECLDAGEFQLVVTDINMPRMDGLTLLRKIGERPGPHPKVVLITGQGSERHAIAAVRAGAYDYIKKPFELEDLMVVARRATESIRLTAEVERLESEVSFGRSLVFASPAMSRLAVLVQRIGPRDVTVLITGESGTGKERIADALVAASRRADKPFIRFNCAALTAELAEAELFGHTRGAFTGAVKSRPGLFREANGGTILLDEIGELPLPIQAKLLRVLQEGEVRPVGEDQSFKVDIRLIAATHRDLMQMAAHGKFREDLYYRLKVVHLQVPPLRERAEDIPILARHFLADCARRFGVGPFKMTPTLLDRLNGYTWPGNVRELQNAIESAVALSPRHELDLALLPEPGSHWAASADTDSDAWREALTSPDLKHRVEHFERTLIVTALEKARGNRSETARALGVNRVTLLGKLIKYGLDDTDATLDGSNGANGEREAALAARRDP